MPPGRGSPILVAVDFSPDSEAAFLWAARAARAFGAALSVLHVVHDPGAAPGYYARSAVSELEHLEDAAARMLEGFVERMRPKLGDPTELPELETRVVVGLPVTRILEAAVQAAAQQIVVGARGRTALAELLLGSKAERVARLAPVPVTIVKAAPRARNAV